jgi:hypothetical protein
VTSDTVRLVNGTTGATVPDHAHAVRRATRQVVIKPATPLLDNTTYGSSSSTV